jgi:hypothetical protein
MRSSPEVAALDRGGQQLVQVALGVAVLGEDDHPGVGPLALGLGAGGAADRDRRALVGADPVEQRRDLGVGSGGVLRGQAAHLGQELGGAAGGAGQGRAGGGHRVGVGGLGRVVVGSVRVVVVGGGGGQVELQRGARAAGGDAGGVDLERAAERLDAGQQPLLQVDEHQLAAAALGAHQPGVLGEQHRQPDLGRVGRADVVLDQHPAREAVDAELAEVVLQAPHHDGGQRVRGRADAAGEALRVEQLEQRREAVRVAVVRRGRQEQAVARSAAPDRASPW